MSPWLIAPLLVVAAGLLGAWCASRLSTPALAARALTGAVVLASAGMASALMLIALAGASELAVVSDAIAWCRALAPGDHGAAPWAGALATAALAVGGRSALRHVRRFRQEVASFGNVTGITVVHAPGVVAHAVPGGQGGIVLGESLISALDDGERDIVVAHERAHLQHHHHLYVLAAETCAAALPLLRPLAQRVRFHTERWADEEAARDVGARLPVARTIAKVALLQPPSSTAVPAFGATDTVDRVQALLGPPRMMSHAMPLIVLGALALTATGTTVQLHHIAGFIAHVCGA